MVVAVGSPPPDGGGFLGSLVTDDAITRAQSVLSAPQVQALQEIQQQQQAVAPLRQQILQNAGATGRGAVLVPGIGGPPPPAPGLPPGG
jgi:hypothetical protein